MIRLCSCRSEYQDKKYGKGKRVFTTSGAPKCTVCGQPFKEGVRVVKSADNDEKNRKKKK